MAPNNAKIKFDIIAELNKSGLDKALASLDKSIGQTVGDGIIERLEAQKSEISKAINSATSVKDIRALQGAQDKISGGIASAMGEEGTGMLGEIAGVLGGIAGGVTVAAVVLKALEQPIQMVGKLVDMVALMLRPISDAIVMLITPVFGMLRPIVQMINLMMMPFKKAAMRLAVSAAKDIADGIANSDAMALGTGTLKMLLGVETMLLGITSVIQKLGLQLLKLLIDGVWNIAKFVYRGVLFIGAQIANLIGQLIPGDQGEMGKRIFAAGETVMAGGDAMMENLFGMYDTLLEKNVDIIKGAIVTQANALGIDLSQDLIKTMENVSYKDIVTTFGTNTADTLVAVATKAWSILKGDLDTTLSEMSYGEITKEFGTNFSQALVDSVNEEWEKIKDSLIPSSDTGTKKSNFMSGVDKMLLDYQTQGGGVSGKEDVSKSMWEKMKESFSKIDVKGLMITNLMSPMDFGFSEILKISNDMMGESLIPDAFLSGFIHMQDITTQYMGIDGVIPKQMGNAFDSISNKTDVFAAKANKLTGILDTAIKKIDMYASKYYAALSKIESMKRASKTRAA